MAEIALRLPAPHRVRAPIMNLHVRQRLGQGPEGENCRDNGGETNVWSSQIGDETLLLSHGVPHLAFDVLLSQIRLDVSGQPT